MKKLKTLLWIPVISGIILTSCEDDETLLERPEITIPTGVSVQVDASTTISFTIDAPGLIGAASVSSSSGMATISNLTALVGQSTGTLTVDYTAASTAGTATVTLQVSDQQSPAKTEEAIVTVTVTEEPTKPEIDVFTSTEGVGNVTWTADNIYILRGFIFVNSGQTLTIEPGTVIKGQPGQGSGASALIVARGGKINAQGTASNPIIFTGLADDLQGSVADDASALWGGVIILGSAPTNNLSLGGVKAVEGIPTDESRGEYGGSDAADNSGTFTYVSIRHGGSVIGADNEINGLTLGAVGSGTTIENIEIIANLDDGIEFFGGTVDVRGFVITYSGDDGPDIDEGYVGTLQQGLVWDTSETIASSDPRGGEWDGGVGADEEAAPYATPVIANVTFVFDSDGTTLSNDCVIFRDNNAGQLLNSILVGYSGEVDIERRTDIASSYDRYVAGDLKIEGNIFFEVNGVTDAANFNNVFEISNESDATLQANMQADLAGKNTFADPGFGVGASRFTPSAAEVTSNLASLPAGLEALTYKGGIDPSASEPFFAGWTLTWQIINK